MFEVPPGSVADGNIMALWVPVLADPSKPKETELTAVGVVDLSLYLTKDGLNLGGDEQTITDERLGSRQTFEAPGTYNDTADVVYVYDAQAALASATNKAQQTLRHLTEGHLVLRYAMPFEEAVAAAQIVDVLTVTCGIQRKQAPESNAKLKIGQKLHVTNQTHRDVAVVAGP